MTIPHRSVGSPCELCGFPAISHDRRHTPDALGEDGACSCGLSAEKHHKARSQSRRERGEKDSRSSADRAYFVGVDGEGKGRSPHRYTLLAWANADGTQSNHIENAKEGLGTEECLEFLLSIPENAKAFAYAFNYDLTKMLADVDDEILYRLFRPELRQRPPKTRLFGPYPELWRGFTLNLQGTKFTIGKDGTKKRRVIWDVFKFFQSKFTSALEDWKVGTPEELDRMRAMKDKRSEFDTQSDSDILHYCYDECQKMAQLAEKLVKAHEDAEIPIKSFYGAGSTGGAILKKEGIGDLVRHAPDKRMHIPIACAFFGGRFENSAIGEVKGPLWSYDISSAYPYQTTFLPCLACGTWTLTKDRARAAAARVALVRYTLGKAPRNLTWGPFPFRTDDGSICYPAESGGGWVWHDEFAQGERLFPHVEFREAWVYECACDHRPFSKIPDYYLFRLQIGKEGPGIVIKLGVNSVYGKLAQSVGDAPPFQSWIWAGLITSGTRGQLYAPFSRYQDLDVLLMAATDGIASREKLVMPAPRPTGTDTWHKKPLGGWEEKDLPKGLFFMRPGIYFPLDPTAAELKSVRARGVGRAVMYESWRKLIEAWSMRASTVTMGNVVRFCGAKTSITRATDKKTGSPIYNRSAQYGEWADRPIELSFDPLPKREGWDSAGRLGIRRLDRSLTSVPYDRSVTSQESLMLRRLNDEVIEQPAGGDYLEFDIGAGMGGI